MNSSTDYIKSFFPLFKEKPELVYLDNASTTQKSKSVIDAITKFYSSENANVHRGLYELSSSATQRYEKVRTQVKDFLGARLEREIAFTKSTTESINIVANSFEYGLNEGDNIAISEMEHHANLIPWQQICKKRKAELRVLPIDKNGDIDLSRLDNLLDNRTKLVAVTHISNVTGAINPIKEIIGTAHAKNIPVLVDAAQSVGHIPMQVSDLDVDFLAFSAHKMFGPMGVGVLYTKEKHHKFVRPLNFGGGAIREVSIHETSFMDYPQNLEAGTPNVGGVIGLGAAIDFILEIDLISTFASSQKLAMQFREGLNKHNLARVISNPKEAAPIVSFVVDGVHPHDVAAFLGDQNIAVRAGHHCAQPLHESLGEPATVRASFSIYNSEHDVLALVYGLKLLKTNSRAKEINALYDEVIKEQNNQPYHFERIEKGVSVVKSNNPICGDRFDIFLEINGEKIETIHFHGFGCSVSKASTSVLAKTLEGTTVSQARKAIDIFLTILDKNKNIMGSVPKEFSAFLAVRQYPARYDCAALAWKEVEKFLAGLKV